MLKSNKQKKTLTVNGIKKQKKIIVCVYMLRMNKQRKLRMSHLSGQTLGLGTVQSNIKNKYTITT